jgi:hypothetical protein
MAEQASSIQIFRISDVEWWAGAGTPEEILAAYIAKTGCTYEDATGDETHLPVPLTASQYEKLKFIDDENDCLMAFPVTFRERLDEMIAAGETFPCFFATTEC